MADWLSLHPGWALCVLTLAVSEFHQLRLIRSSMHFGRRIWAKSYLPRAERKLAKPTGTWARCRLPLACRGRPRKMLCSRLCRSPKLSSERGGRWSLSARDAGNSAIRTDDCGRPNAAFQKSPANPLDGMTTQTGKHARSGRKEIRNVGLETDGNRDFSDVSCRKSVMTVFQRSTIRLR